MNQERLTDEQVQEIKERKERAETADWKRSIDVDGSPYMVVMGEDCVTFAENAVNDVDLLLADREHLQAENERLKKQLKIAEPSLSSIHHHMWRSKFTGELHVQLLQDNG